MTEYAVLLPSSADYSEDHWEAARAEQRTGFYLATTDDLDALLRVCGIPADGDGAVEVRSCVEMESSS